jgi:hypothetical protein
MAPEFYDVMQAGDLEGYERRRSQAREAAVLSAAQLIADVRRGAVPWYLLMEALQPRTPAIVGAMARNYPGLIRLHETMTTSDFPLPMGDVMDRMMLARWNAFPQAWRSFVGVTRRTDFRLGRAVYMDGLEGAYVEQAEEEELEYGKLDEGGYNYGLKLYSKGAKVSWKAIINDNLNAFDTIPDRLGRGGARTVARFVTDLYVGTSGPDSTFFSAGNGNIITGNPALSISALATAFGLLRGMKDADGEPIMVESAVLVVPPALEVVARNILNATQVELTAAGGVSGQTLTVANWLPGSLTLVVDPYIPIIATSANGNTSWFLFPNPNVARPAIEVAFLQGFDTPQLYQKIANTARTGGGLVQEMGDFNTMSQEWKGVVVFGGSLLDPKSAVASNGSGS